MRILLEGTLVPFKLNHLSLGNSYKLAKRCFLKLENKLNAHNLKTLTQNL